MIEASLQAEPKDMALAPTRCGLPAGQVSIPSIDKLQRGEVQPLPVLLRRHLRQQKSHFVTSSIFSQKMGVSFGEVCFFHIIPPKMSRNA